MWKKTLLFVYALLLLTIGLKIHYTPSESDKKVLAKSIVRLTSISGRSGCTGWITRLPKSQTLVTVTNSHCSELGYRLKTDIQNKDMGEITLIYNSGDTDIAIYTAPESYKAEGLELADKLNPDKDIMVLGHPGLRDLTETHGIWVMDKEISIPDFNRSPETCIGNKYMVDEVQFFFGITLTACVVHLRAQLFSGQVRGGNSGSPAIQDGRVVGVVFASDSDTVGIMIPLNALLGALYSAENYLK